MTSRAGAEGAGPPSLPRAVVGARLLAVRAAEEGPGHLADWLRASLDLLEDLEERPPEPTTAAACERTLDAFAAHLEHALLRLDAGDALDGLLSAARLAPLQAGLEAALGPGAAPAAPAGTAGCPLLTLLGAGDGRDPAACLELMRGLLAGIRDGDGDGPAARRLARRWREIRALGDARFAPDAGPATEPASSPQTPAPSEAAAATGEDGAGRIILLCDSSLRSGEIFARLSAAGHDVEVCPDPGAVVRRLAEAAPPVAVICDNLEPSRHLQRLARLLAAAPSPGPPLVLATAGSRGIMDRLARRLGARGVWAPPFGLEALRALIGPVR